MVISCMVMHVIGQILSGQHCQVLALVLGLALGLV
jgi:hypothetical protein